jgi:NADPH:quinone reductase
MKAVWYERTGPAADVLTFGEMRTLIGGPGEVRVWLFNGQRNGRAFGTAAEYIALSDHLVTPLPDNLSFAQGATLGIPAMTAWCSLFGEGPIAGQTVLSPAAPAAKTQATAKAHASREADA